MGSRAGYREEKAASLETVGGSCNGKMANGQTEGKGHDVALWWCVKRKGTLRVQLLMVYFGLWRFNVAMQHELLLSIPSPIVNKLQRNLSPFSLSLSFFRVEIHMRIHIAREKDERGFKVSAPLTLTLSPSLSFCPAAQQRRGTDGFPFEPTKEKEVEKMDRKTLFSLVFHVRGRERERAAE